MTLMPVFDFVGTIAFAVLGAMAGIYKKLDVFGVVLLALATAVGGGIMRDVVISNTPPMAFRDPTYVIVGIGSAFLAMMLRGLCERFVFIIQVCDAIGLGSFTAAGANTAMVCGQGSLITVIFLAVVTAVGGGVIRDVLIQQLSSVLYKEIYATASLAGAVVFYIVYQYFSAATAMYICFFVTTGLRLLALKYHWNLPVVQ